VSESVAQRRFQMRIAASFALSALLLAALGIYGVVAYGIASRRREFGIRLALGASGGDIGRLVIASGMRPVVLGFLAGIAGALAAGRLIGSLLFGVRVTDQTTLAAVAAAVLGMAALACFAPARAASRVDPLLALRDE